MSSALRVLIVHYDETQRQLLADSLGALGAQCRSVAQGAEALEVGAQFQPHLALVSTLLSGVSGFEVCRKLAQPEDDRQAVPVVLLSDVEDPYVRARARHSGACRLEIEPLEGGLLAELLEPCVGGVGPVEEEREFPAGEPGNALLGELLGERDPPASDNLMAKLSDPLTGLLTVEYMQMKVDEEAKRADRYKAAISLLIGSIDNYDAIVRQHGRTAGDEALLEVAGVFLCESRDVDLAGRGEEGRFLLLMPNTPVEGARAAAQRIEASLNERRLQLGSDEVELVISLGLASLIGGKQKVSRAELLRLAEADMQAARENGLRGRASS